MWQQPLYLSAQFRCRFSCASLGRCCSAGLSSRCRPSCRRFLSGRFLGQPTTVSLLKDTTRRSAARQNQTRTLIRPERTFPRHPPMIARAVALVSFPFAPSSTSSPDPSSLQRLMVLFPELIQYSCSASKSMERPGKHRRRHVTDEGVPSPARSPVESSTHRRGLSDWRRGCCDCCHLCWPC